MGELSESEINSFGTPPVSSSTIVLALEVTTDAINGDHS